MSAGFYLWLAGAMAVFLAASSSLRAYVSTDRVSILLLALTLYIVGNLMMVRVMRESGLAVAISLSAILQLIAASAVAYLVFGERPTAVQGAGIALGVVAVALIVWPGRSAT